MKTRETLSARERQLIEIAMHESAHAVCGTVLGGTLRTATLTSLASKMPVTGRTTFDMLPTGLEPLVAYSGPWAQARWRCDGPPTQRELCDVMNAGHDSDLSVLLAAGGTAVGAPVAGLVERCWTPIIDVARALIRCHTIRRDVVNNALALSCDPATSALQLALIRAVPPRATSG